jgi:hypothetical protein
MKIFDVAMTKTKVHLLKMQVVIVKGFETHAGIGKGKLLVRVREQKS